MSKTFCPLPWIHLATRPNGDVSVCCTANASGAGKQDEKTAGLVKKDGIAMNLRDHTIEEVWNSEHMRRTRLQMLNGEIPSSCTKCFSEEAKGITSKRQWESAEWKQRVDFDNLNFDGLILDCNGVYVYRHFHVLFVGCFYIIICGLLCCTDCIVRWLFLYYI